MMAACSPRKASWPKVSRRIRCAGSLMRQGYRAGVSGPATSTPDAGSGVAGWAWRASPQPEALLEQRRRHPAALSGDRRAFGALVVGGVGAGTDGAGQGPTGGAADRSVAAGQLAHPSPPVGRLGQAGLFG